MLRRQREYQRAEQVAGIGDGDRRHILLLAELDQLLDLDRSFGERIGGVDAQVDEIGNRHGVLNSAIGERFGNTMPSWSPCVMRKFRLTAGTSRQSELMR